MSTTSSITPGSTPRLSSIVEAGVLGIGTSPVIGLVVETHCEYFSPVAFPDTVHVGLRVARLGARSVRYELAVFRNDETRASAQGHFVHVYVDRATNRPTSLPAPLRQALQPLVMAA